MTNSCKTLSLLSFGTGWRKNRVPHGTIHPWVRWQYLSATLLTLFHSSQHYNCCVYSCTIASVAHDSIPKIYVCFTWRLSPSSRSHDAMFHYVHSTEFNCYLRITIWRWMNQLLCGLTCVCIKTERERERGIGQSRRDQTSKRDQLWFENLKTKMFL